MYNNKSISVVISTFKERLSIRKFVEEVEGLGVIDEVIVVNNNAEEGTDDEVKETNAKLFYETRQGYGYGYSKGLEKARGDLIIMSDTCLLYQQILKIRIGKMGTIYLHFQ